MALEAFLALLVLGLVWLVVAIMPRQLHLIPTGPVNDPGPSSAAQ